MSEQTKDLSMWSCANFAPAGFQGHWRDWHRGHGCGLDPLVAPVVPPTPQEPSEPFAKMRRELRTDGPDSHRLLIWLGDVEHQMDDLRAENTRLREALTPFAAMADAYDPPEDDDHEIVWDRKPTLGQLRAARAAVERQHAAALAEKDAQIAELNNSLANEVLTVLAAENATLRAQVEDVTAELRDERGRHGTTLVSAEANTSELHRRITALRASLASVEGELDRLRERVARALCVENPDGPVSDDALVEAADATLTQLLDFNRSALAAVDAEEELDGPMPSYMRARFLASPETTMRSLVRVTKAGIRARLQAALAPAAQTPETTTDTVKPEVPNLMVLIDLTQVVHG